MHYLELPLAALMAGSEGAATNVAGWKAIFNNTTIAGRRNVSQVSYVESAIILEEG